MNRFKFWLEQTMMISFAIFSGILIEGLVYKFAEGSPLSSFALSWYQILSVILTGAICSLPTIFLLSDNEGFKTKFIVRVIIHCLGLYAAVSLIGWAFQWYTKIDGFIMVTIIFFMVYVFVWVVSLWFHKRDEDQINKALEDIRDKE